MKPRYLLLIITILLSVLVHAQDPKRFQKEIDTIDLRNSKKAGSHELIVFTGSSSIRRWNNVTDYFPGKNIINTGFGGSQMSDLLYYSDSVIIKYKPVRVFIYEGDNDVAAGKKTDDILRDTEMLIKKISVYVPGVQIVIISVKPSVLRWKLKEEYIKLNSEYKSLTTKYGNVSFVNVWDPLLNEKGLPKKEIFVSDSLHINKLGYDIWAKEIKRFIK